MSIHYKDRKRKKQTKHKATKIGQGGKGSAVVVDLKSQITSDEDGPCLSFDRTYECERSQECNDGFKGFRNKGLVATPSGGMNPMVDATTKVKPSQTVRR